MKQISLLFRRPGPSTHSIERVFSMLMPHFTEQYQINEIKLPYSNKGYLNKIRNIFWTAFFVKQPIHVTGDVYYSILLKRGNMMATIHDIGVLSEVNPVTKLIIKFFWFDLIARKCSKLVFVSNHSRNDFLTRVRCDISKTVVIYNPLSSEIRYIERTFRDEKPVILQIGTKANKNIERLAQALKGIDCHLRIIGKLNSSQIEELQKNEIDYSASENITAKEIREEYIVSDLVVFASTHEGFGIPIIEGQATGRPVVTSNVSSMPEIAGDGACFVDPYNSDDIRNGILRVIKDKDYRTMIISKGLENANRFNQKQIALQYIKLYSELLGDE